METILRQDPCLLNNAFYLIQKYYDPDTESPAKINYHIYPNLKVNSASLFNLLIKFEGDSNGERHT